MDKTNKKELSESDICDLFLQPAIRERNPTHIAAHLQAPRANATTKLAKEPN